MARVLVIYYSRRGSTAKMAEAVAQGAEAAGATVALKEATQITPEDLTGVDGLIVGSPTYYGLPAAEVKAVFDQSVRHHGKLDGRAGGAFASCGTYGGGVETTVMSILQMLLVHGMVVQGAASGAHYGPVSQGAPDDRCRKECHALGERVARLAERLEERRGDA